MPFIDRVAFCTPTLGFEVLFLKLYVRKVYVLFPQKLSNFFMKY